MLIYRRTSVLDSPAQTLVNTVNCVGVMGKGIAKAFKDRYPEMFSAYKRICDAGLLEPGKLWLWNSSDQWVLNFPTKVHWRNPSRLEWIEMGLDKFRAEYANRSINQISFPRLGCGNGGLDWEEVRPLMEHYLAPLPINVFIHDFEQPIGLPEHLEALSQQLRTADTPWASFDHFMNALDQALTVSGGVLHDMTTDAPFNARMVGEALEIKTATGVTLLDGEDLRGVWLSLKSGLLTAKEAGWSETTNGGPLLSLLSVLPHVRALQIQRRAGEHPELALELRRQAPSPATGWSSGSQRELSWA